MTTRIKICGITNPDDALQAVEAGADYLGFNFYPPSPRYISPLRVRKILDHLQAQGIEEVRGVGVFVNESLDSIRQTMQQSGLRIVQLHGQETPEFASGLSEFTVIKALKVTNASWTADLADYGVEAFLADAPSTLLHGGSGESYDYTLVAEAARAHKIFLAGGLHPNNVAAAIAAVQPYAVDVASGVESSPGHKDPALVQAFCKAVRG